MSVQNWFAFGACWSNFGPLVAKNVGFLPLSEKVFTQSHWNLVYSYWVRVQPWLAFGPCWPNCCPLVATKMTENGGFRPLSKNVFMQSNSNLVCTLIGWVFRIDSRYQKKYSCNPIQTWCVHLLGECSELIRFWAMLAKFWPSSGHKMNQICGFWLLFEKVFTQYNSNLVSTFVWWVHSWFAFGHVGRILALKWPKN